MNRVREMVARSVPFSAQIARALSAAALTSGDAGCHDGGAYAKMLQQTQKLCIASVLERVRYPLPR